MYFVHRHKIKTTLILLAATFVAFIVYANQVILRDMADLWVVSDPLEGSADAIVVLGGGLDYRPRAAADLYIQGKGRQIWITRGKPENGPAMADAPDPTHAMIVKFGVPDAAIVDVPGRASSTYEEAKLVSKLIGVSGRKTLLIPTDPFHTRRAKWIFTKLNALQSNRILVRPVPSNLYTQEHWWLSAAGRISFANEIMKYFYYRVRY